MQAYQRTASLVLLTAMLAGACGSETSDKPKASARPAAAAAPLMWLADKPAPAVAAEPAVPAPGSPDMARMNALPHLSALSEREKAGLLMLLPNKTTAQRLDLIEMYPSLAGLPVQQKQVLLDRLEKIVPLPSGQPR